MPRKVAVQNGACQWQASRALDGPVREAWTRYTRQPPRRNAPCRFTQ
jgi:hypothetical protein